MQAYQEQLPLQQQTNYNMINPNYSDHHHEVSPFLPWTLPQVHNHHPIMDPNFPIPYINPPPSSFTNLFEGQGVPQSAYDHEHLGRVINYEPVVHRNCQSGLVGLLGLQTETAGNKTSVQELLDAKALAASKSHSEAERRRRERINNHLAKLRSLLPSTTKTDKASLLAEVLQQVKELKRQTSIIADSTPIPTEIDELIVNTSDSNGKLLIKATICCEDRNDLLPDLIKTLKSLHLKTLKAEITTLGGRVKNVLFITGEANNNLNEGGDPQPSMSCIEEALKAVMMKSSLCDHQSSMSGSSVKRQRTANIIM
ncbi:hypothetical protein ACFE04_030429 [Oxalis oulophora]